MQNLKIPPLFPLDKPFDAAFSNAALHWCKRNPAGVLEGLKCVLKPGGRFVCEMGGFMNCIGREQPLTTSLWCVMQYIQENAGVRMALHYALRKRGSNPEEMDPWYFPTVEEYQTVSYQRR